MTVEQTRRLGSHWMIVAIAMLAFAVFSWGVRYKLSLYNPAAHMSAAKLLSERERPATIGSTKLAADPVINLEPVTFFALAMGVLLAWIWSLTPSFTLKNGRQGTQLPKQSDQTFFFFRPPPSFSASR